MTIRFKPIGYVHNPHQEVPRHWSVSDLEGALDILPEYEDGLVDIGVGQRIVVIFHFDRSITKNDQGFCHAADLVTTAGFRQRRSEVASGNREHTLAECG